VGQGDQVLRRDAGLIRHYLGEYSKTSDTRIRHRDRCVSGGGAGRVLRQSASPSIAGIVLHCRELEVW
jgi:hypothetical protein